MSAESSPVHTIVVVPIAKVSTEIVVSDVGGGDQVRDVRGGVLEGTVYVQVMEFTPAVVGMPETFHGTVAPLVDVEL